MPGEPRRTTGEPSKEPNAVSLRDEHSQLRASETRYRFFVEAIPHLVWSCDADGQTTDFSQRCLDYMGMTHEQAHGLGWMSAVHASDAAVVRERWKVALETGEDYAAEYRVRRASDGAYRWLKASASPMRGPDGAIVAWFGASTDVEDERRMAEDLGRTHTLLEKILSSSPTLFFVTDAEGKITLLEGMCVQAIGLDRKDYLGEPVSKLFGDKSEGATAAKEALGGKSVQKYFEREGIWLDARFEPILDAEKKVSGVACLASDITELRRSMREVRESEARYRMLTEALPAMVWLLDPVGIATYVNATFQEFTGLSAADYNSLGHKAFIHPNDLPGVMKVRGDGLAHGSAVSMENRYKGKSGEYRWYLSGIKPIRDEDGTISQWIGTAVDIHERKLAEEALRLNEEQLRLVLEVSGDGIWDYDMARETTVWSKRSYELLGLAPGEAEPGFDLFLQQVHPDDREVVIAQYKNRLDPGANYRAEFRIRDFDGQYRWRQAEGMTFCDDSGNPIRLLGAFSDIHDRKSAEERYRSLNLNLEDRVSERTHELEATTGELQEFCYSVSHDLRGPLRSINGFGKALEEDYGHLLDDEGRAFLARIRNATVRLSDLIDSLLSMSRITRVEMARKPIDLSRLAREILDELAAADPTRKVEVEIAEGAFSYGDESLCRTALRNLLENSWKFTSKRKSAKIEFGVQDGGSEPTFFVRDNGAGYDMAYQDKLFTPFQRLHTEAEFPGTGVGLAIVGRVVQRHGGTVAAEGRVGEGATFFFTLPSRREDLGSKAT